jgi:hypothetical protein
MNISNVCFIGIDKWGRGLEIDAHINGLIASVPSSREVQGNGLASKQLALS